MFGCRKNDAIGLIWFSRSGMEKGKSDAMRFFSVKCMEDNGGGWSAES